MLYQNAPFVLLTVCLFLVYIIYTADDTTPGSSNAQHDKLNSAQEHNSDIRKPNGANNGAFQNSRHLKQSHLQQPGQQQQQQPRPSPLVVGKNKTRLKTILYWNEFYGRYDTYDFGYGHEAFVEKRCKFSNCFATKDRNLLPSIDQFDAIIIHIRGLPNDWPERRSPG